MTTYTRTIVAGPINHAIKEASKNDGAYSFGEDPICNYAETVTVTNLPAFVTHNLATADFTIDYVDDLSLVGEYIVTIRSEICVPDDYTGATCTVLADEYDFSIYINPCLVTAYTDTTTVTVISYNIGAPDLTDGLYVFDEDPVCNYPETVTVTNLPAFMLHNEPVSDFTVTQVTDLALLGEYTVTLRSEICVPDDYTEATCTVMLSEYDFVV